MQNLNSIGLTVEGSSNKFFAVGNTGTILLSTNNGNNWSIVNSGVTDNLNSIFSKLQFSRSKMWIAASNGKILVSNSFGNSWSAVNTGIISDFNSIHFVDSLTGFAVGTGGKLIKTTNSGYNWTSINLNTANNLNSIYFVSNGMGFIVGDGGLIYRTTNSGNDWVLETNSLTVNLNSVYTSGGLDAYSVGNNGLIMQRKINPTYNPLVQFYPNSGSTFFHTSGIFNRNVNITNRPGFEWPRLSGKYVVYSSGLSIAAYVNNELRMASASYKGEYTNGYVLNNQLVSDINIKFYLVSRTDSRESHDWRNWGIVVPFGAPYIDVNNNFQYDYLIDTPGVKNAIQTIFGVLTDADTSKHTLGEGFGGGTKPLMAELRITAWGYDSIPIHNNNVLSSSHFIKWDIINKGTTAWNNTFFSVVLDPDVGDGTDDYIGCDSTRDLSFTYNADNNDGDYGPNPPAVGFMFLKTPNNLGMTSSNYFTCTSCSPVVCESDPNGDPLGAYNLMKGFKKDLTPYVIPNTNPPQTTKFTYSGDPQENTGWTEYKGSVKNCGGSLTGEVVQVNPSGDRRQIHSTGSENQTILPGEKQTIVFAQFVERGNSNVNSVTQLKQKSDVIRNFYNSVSIKNISEIIPDNYRLFQNYPNPFNPITKIKFSIPERNIITLKIYDMTGKEISAIINQNLTAGSYEYEFDASNLPSGVYFYKLTSGSKFSEVKKMVLIK